MESDENIMSEPKLMNTRVVWYDSSGKPVHGEVRWIGKMTDVGDGWIAGVHLDHPLGHMNGYWNDRLLFPSNDKHGLLIPVGGLVSEDILNAGDRNNKVESINLDDDEEDDDVILISVKRILTSSENLNNRSANDDSGQGGGPVKKMRSNESVVGWICTKCEFVNVPTRPGCEFCAEPRPEGYTVPADYVPTESERQRIERAKAENEATRKFIEEQEQQEQESLECFARLDEQTLVVNTDDFNCPICMEDHGPGKGVVLKACLHTFCRECMIGTVQNSEDPIVACPYVKDDFRCTKHMQEMEVRELVPADVYDQFLQRGVRIAESNAENSFHCKTPDCRGWCIFEDEVNVFKCSLCKKKNCLTCQAIHEGTDCRSYQERLEFESATDGDMKKTMNFLKGMLDKGEAMRCPKCRVIVMKKTGCDWIVCSVCKTELCWVTRGPRWGPMGRGDTSGGCKCLVNGKYCHPKCQNCH